MDKSTFPHNGSYRCSKCDCSVCLWIGCPLCFEKTMSNKLCEKCASYENKENLCEICLSNGSEDE